MAELRSHRDLPAVRFDDATANGEASPRLRARIGNLHKRLEHPPEIVVRNPAAGVAHGNRDVALPPGGIDVDRAACRRGANRIHHEVRNHTFDLTEDRPYLGQSAPPSRPAGSRPWPRPAGGEA